MLRVKCRDSMSVNCNIHPHPIQAMSWRRHLTSVTLPWFHPNKVPGILLPELNLKDKLSEIDQAERQIFLFSAPLFECGIRVLG